MKNIGLYLRIVVVLALSVTAAVLHGHLSNRWGPPQDVLGRASRLTDVPAVCGPWRQARSEELSKVVERTLQCNGYLNRTYVHEKTGESIHVAVIIGPFGPMSVHTPEICYSSREYEIQEARHRIAVRTQDNRTDELWALSFRNRTVATDALQVYYGWSAGDSWSAPDSPRFAFRGQRFLYKLQLAHYVPAQTVVPQSKEPKTDSGTSFLEHFLPQLDRVMAEQNGA